MSSKGDNYIVFFLCLAMKLLVVGLGFTENLLKGFTLIDSFFYNTGAGDTVEAFPLYFWMRLFTAFPNTSGDIPLPDSIVCTVGVLSLDWRREEELAERIVGLLSA